MNKTTWFIYEEFSKAGRMISSENQRYNTPLTKSCHPSGISFKKHPGCLKFVVGKQRHSLHATKIPNSLCGLFLCAPGFKALFCQLKESTIIHSKDNQEKKKNLCGWVMQSKPSSRSMCVCWLTKVCSTVNNFVTQLIMGDSVKVFQVSEILSQMGAHVLYFYRTF